MRTRTQTVLVTVCLIVLLAFLIGCATTTTPEGQEQTGFSPGAQAVGDTATVLIKGAAEATAPLLPAPWGTLVAIGATLLYGAWQTIRNVKLTKGARVTAAVIESTVKADAGQWAIVGTALAAAEKQATGLLAPTMPDDA